MTTLYGFEMWDERAQRWDQYMPGHQDWSNCFATRLEAERELLNLAKVLDCEPDQLRVAPIVHYAEFEPAE